MKSLSQNTQSSMMTPGNMDGKDLEKLIQQLKQSTRNILLHNRSNLQFQLAHHYLFEVYKVYQPKEILQTTIYSQMDKIISQTFSSLKPESNSFLQEVSQLIQKTQKNLQTIKDYNFYIDKNYFQKELKTEMIVNLNAKFLILFLDRQQLLKEIGICIAKEHLNNNQSNIKRVLQSIKMIDKEELHFQNSFQKYYSFILEKYYQTQSKQKFDQYNNNEQIQLFIKYAYDILEKQCQFLNKFWPNDKKYSKIKNLILQKLYQTLVTPYKTQILENHSNKVFNQLTLQIMELFKFDTGIIVTSETKDNKNNQVTQNNKGTKDVKDIQLHAEWYNKQIKKTLDKFSKDNNIDFIDSICEFYKKIMNLLQKTVNKFDIHYRSRFAFEEWINNSRLQVPLRLNEYINDFCLQKEDLKNQSDDKILEKIDIIFVLMKQKKVFEKYYRRELINRILGNFAQYSMKRQKQIIQMMQKQCSEEFVKDIKPLMESYLNPMLNTFQKKNQKLNVFLMNMQNWPYEQKNASVSINQHLTSLTQKYTQHFNTTNKDKTIYWHPIIGIIKLQISFLKSNWSGLLIINTCMTNLILHFIKTKGQSYELKNFCCQTGYKLDEVYDSVRKLIHTKIILNQGTDENYKLSLNEQFNHSGDSFDVININMTNKFEEKPLEQLKADRKFMVEAIIVKILKKQKNTKKQTILEFAKPLIQKRGFNFNQKFVQSAIQRLIEKQFIRDHEDGNYGYIA